MSPEGIEELTDEQQDKQNDAKQAAAEALEDGKQEEGLAKLTEAISIGCASALLYSRRAQVLMQLDRPGAAINDCKAALVVNPDSAKALKIRARAYKKMGKMEEAHADFSQALKLDYDEETYDESLEVAAKAKEMAAEVTKKRVEDEKAEAARILQENKEKYMEGLRANEAKWKEAAEAEAEAKRKAEEERKERVRAREKAEDDANKEPKADEPGVPKSHGPAEDVD